MVKKLMVLVLVCLIAVPVFADVSAALGVQFATDKSTMFTLDVAETCYFDNSAFFRFDVGGALKLIDEDNSQFGLDCALLGGYSFRISDLLRIDLGGGLQAFESSAILYVIKAAAKDTEYKMSFDVGPVADASVLFGLENLSIRAGVRGAYLLKSSGVALKPYVAVSSDFLDFINIF